LTSTLISYKKSGDISEKYKQKIINLIIALQPYAKIYLFGSQATGTQVAGSDIDIALEGVASADEYFQIYGEAMKLTDFPLDIIEIERIEPEFREMIVQQGRLVHERK
jgi:predicted nucleotidyltransferase